jgi:hypothetical protein
MEKLVTIRIVAITLLLRNFEMIKYPSIDQYRHTIRSIKEHCFHKFAKRDENGEIIPDQGKTWTLPTVTFKGEVKIHGSNASINWNAIDDTLTWQSRNRVLTIESDNAGFAMWCESNRQEIKEFFSSQWSQHELLDNIVVFGEWCGGNIQKGVGVSNLPKMFVIFEVHIYFNGELIIKDVKYMKKPEIASCYLITDFPTWEIEIDFEHPELVQNKLVDLTIAVEDECPVAKHFGVSGVGEGIVWHYDMVDHRAIAHKRLRFKVKGEKHSNSKVKTLANVDVEEIKKVSDFVDTYLTEARLKQGIDFIKEAGLRVTPASTGPFVRWVTGDLFKEETDTIIENKLDPKLIGKEASNQARKWLFQNLED